jgi:proteic killer suppression protein
MRLGRVAISRLIAGMALGGVPAVVDVGADVAGGQCHACGSAGLPVRCVEVDRDPVAVGGGDSAGHIVGHGDGVTIRLGAPVVATHDDLVADGVRDRAAVAGRRVGAAASGDVSAGDEVGAASRLSSVTVRRSVASISTLRPASTFHRRRVRRLGPDVQKAALRKLRMLDAATSIDNLRVPPGNRLERLRGDRAGQYSIRVNRQWRICFRWETGDPHDVESTTTRRP